MAAGGVLGLLSSAHCLGMCGPIALFAGARAGGADARGRAPALVWMCAGKALTYGCIGLLFGWAGHLLTSWGAWMGVAHALPVAGGSILILAGLFVAGVFPRLEIRLRGLESRLGEALGSLGGRPGAPAFLAAGMLWGLLPCPMVLVPALASAVSGGAGGVEGAARGFFMMTGFGLGTTPALLVPGLAGERLLGKVRPFGHPAWMGAILIALGAGLVIWGPRMSSSAHGCC